MSYSEEDYLMISGMQHFVFCQRQWALIHLENQWQENRLTAEGDVIHKNAHKENFLEKRPGILITRGLSISSTALGMTGKCDVVEFQAADAGALLHGRRGLWQVTPVEYKRGKDKQDTSDILQLCCEAMCLEEMLACEIPIGYLYYHEIRRRRKIEFTESLRVEVQEVAKQMHALYRRGYTPKVKVSKKCTSCSLREICLPKLCKNISVHSYIQQALGENKT